MLSRNRDGLDHPDWVALRKESDRSVPVLNRKAQRAFAWTIVGVGELYLGLLLAFPMTTTHFVNLTLALGAVLGFLLGVWPHHHKPKSHTALRIAGGFMTYLFARRFIYKAIEMRSRKSHTPAV